MSKRKKEYAIDVLKREIEARKMKLKRCPFCGGKADIEGISELHYISCKNCYTETRAYGSKAEAINAWNTRNYLEKQDSSNSSEIPNSSKELMEFVKFCRNASANDIKQIHDRARDLIAEHKECCEKYCKDESATLKPLVPKWNVCGYNGCILRIPISQQDALQFIVSSSNDNKYMCEVGISVSEVEEIGTFNTLEGAKAKANECIKELGEKLVYFANNIKTEK